MGNTFGQLFRVTTFGESHGVSVGAVVDGCPSRLPLTEEDLQRQLDRRRPGQSDLTTQRNEADRVQIVSGVEKGVTLGSPICLVVQNRDQRTDDYAEMANAPRPSHADFTYKSRYGILASSGGGRASARETTGRVAAGAVAEKFMRDRFGVEIVAWVRSVQEVASRDPDFLSITRDVVDRSSVRCPDPEAAEAMAGVIRSVRDEGDSVGGVITCICRGVPAGWGDPVFDKISARLAWAMMSIPACHGFEIGSGFAATRMLGSEHNDVFVKKDGRIGTTTNRSGGIQGGITNGEPIVFRVAFKPPATLGRPQTTADWNGNEAVLTPKGRHDPCVLPRAVPVVEAMAALVLADAALTGAAG